MTLNKQLKAVVVGCGSIGALKPNKYDKPHGKNILTHAHAYKISSDVELVGVIDTDITKAKQASKKWNTEYACLDDTQVFSSWDYAMGKWKPDIISVCVPTEKHNETLDKIIRSPHKPKLVVVEKPFCSDIKEAYSKYTEYGIPILVNYTRRFSLDYDFLHKKIQRGLLGEIYHARLLYGRGLLRDGCHGVDIFNWFFGKIKGIIVMNTIHDYLPEDPTVSAVLQYDKCDNVQLIGVDSSKYGIFEMELVTEKGIIRLVENGNLFYSYFPREEKIYGGYKTISGISTDTIRTDLTNALSRMILNASRHLLYNEPLLCTAEDAIKVHLILDDINKVKALTKNKKEKDK